MGRITFTIIGIALLVATLLSMQGYRIRPASGATRQADASCRVLVVYDGDTIGCDLNRDGSIRGQQEHVRMLGIDAPEMHYSRKNKTGKNEPLAAEAKGYITSHTLNKTVYLEYDVQRYDRYDRTLAYVYLDPEKTRMLNRRLLQAGLADVLFIAPNLRYAEDFSALRRRADRQDERNRHSSRPGVDR